MITNNAGMRIFDILPIPLSTFLCEINHKRTHNKRTPIVVGIKRNPAFDKLELPPTVSVKKAAASAPQLNVKLLKRYTKSQLRITI